MFAVPPTSTDLLERAACKAWAADARGRHWTLWVRLSVASQVSFITIEKYVTHWATQFRRDIPGAAIQVGLHLDTDRLHAHALLFVPRRWTDPHCPPGISIVGWAWVPWLAAWWRHGRVWARPYDHDRNRSTHGAAEYLARDPGTVLSFGTAPRTNHS